DPRHRRPAPDPGAVQLHPAARAGPLLRPRRRRHGRRPGAGHGAGLDPVRRKLDQSRMGRPAALGPAAGLRQQSPGLRHHLVRPGRRPDRRLRRAGAQADAMTARLHTLDNGVRVICDPMPGLKTLAAVVAVRGGARWEDEARAGWSHLLEHLVFKGAGEMGAREIVERIEAQGGSINAATGYERTSFQVRTLDGCLPTALQVLSDLVFRPTLAPVEIEREKDVVAQEIAEADDTPDDHVFEMAQAAAFAGQPLGRPILGSTTSLGGADAAAIEAWRRVLYSPDRMVVSVAGAVDEAELLDLARRWLGGQASAPAEAPAPARFVGGPATEARRIEQANLVFQIPAPAATDPAQPALRLFAEILGGGMA